MHEVFVTFGIIKVEGSIISRNHMSSLLFFLRNSLKYSFGTFFNLISRVFTFQHLLNA